MLKDISLQFLLTFLSYFTPKNKRLLVFGCGNKNEFQGHPKYLMLYLKNVSNVHNHQYCWVTESVLLQQELEEKGIPVVLKYSVKGFFTLLRAQWFFHEKSSKDVYYLHSIIGRFNFFQTWHGTPLKKIGLDKILDQQKGFFYTVYTNPFLFRISKFFGMWSMFKYEAILAPSEEVQQVLVKCFGNNRVLNLGYPRNDVFFDKRLLYRDLAAEFQFDKYASVIVYAPTFRDNLDSVAPLTTAEWDQLNDLLVTKNEVLVVKKHPWEKVLQVPVGLTNVVDLSAKVNDIQELLVHTDVLITDYSSVFFDFMISKKPILFYAYDLEAYKQNCRDMYYAYETVVPGPIAMSGKELIEMLSDVNGWFLENNNQEKYAAINEKFNKMNDGVAAKRVLDYVKP